VYEIRDVSGNTREAPLGEAIDAVTGQTDAA
jgi:hypothetical protein